MIAASLAAVVALVALEGPGGSCKEEKARHQALIDVTQRRLVEAVPPRVTHTEFRPGCAVVTFRIEADGSVGDVRVVTATRKALGVDAARGVRQWRFTSGAVEQAAVHIEFALSRE
jgi:TonB family protein